MWLDAKTGLARKVRGTSDWRVTGAWRVLVACVTRARKAKSSGGVCGRVGLYFGLSPVGFFSELADLSRYAFALAV